MKHTQCEHDWEVTMPLGWWAFLAQCSKCQQEAEFVAREEVKP